MKDRQRKVAGNKKEQKQTETDRDRDRDGDKETDRQRERGTERQTKAQQILNKESAPTQRISRDRKKHRTFKGRDGLLI